jgi:hypothetical protein
MALAVLRVSPVKASALSAMSKHHARKHSATDVHIDPLRSNANHFYVGSGDPAADVQQVLSQYRLARGGQPDPTVACEIILTASKEYFDRDFPGWKDDRRALAPWLNAQNKFLKEHKDEVGKAVSVVLHLDEDAPHLHVVTVPLSKTRIKNSHCDRTETRVSYSAIFGDTPMKLAEARRLGTTATDTKLGRLQTAYAEAMQDHGLDLTRGNSNTGKKHVSPSEFREILATETPDITTKNLNTVTRPDEIVGIKDRFKAAIDIIKSGDDAPIIQQHQTAENEFINEAIARKKLIPDATKLRALETEVAILNVENSRLKREVKDLSDTQKSIADELKQNKELLKEYRGLTEYDLVRGKVATLDELSAFSSQSGRKFNALDYIKYRDKCDLATAVYTLAESFSPDQLAKTAGQLKADDLVPKAFAEADKNATIVNNALNKLDTDLAQTITIKTTTPAHKAKEINVSQQTEAIGASLYRVTLMSKDPSQPTFNLGKGKNGEPEKFFSDKELLDLIPTLSYRNAKGYNIFITPMPDEERRFILLDDIRDISKAKEFEPAIVLQTSPASQQALYVVDGKTAEPAARAFFNAINKGNGDEKITGLIHPMRLAGFTNRKDKYQQDGQFPFVRIVESNGGISQKATDDIFDFQMRMERSTETMPEITKPKKKLAKEKQPDLCLKSDDIDKSALKTWYSEQVEYWAEKTDFSRIDRRLCAAMAEAGYTESDAKDALLSVSPGIKQRHPDVDRYVESKTKDLEYTQPEPAIEPEPAMEPEPEMEP